MDGALGTEAFHCRGLDEKIWNVFAPNSAALSAERSSDPAIEVWCPRRTAFLHNKSRVLQRVALFLAFVAAASGATIRLYLTDGTYQMAREYQVLQDRVRFYSTERSDWEEIPLELVDLNRTKKEVAAQQEVVENDVKAQAEEDAAERAAREEVARIPAEAGSYFIHGAKLETMKQAESKLVNDKKRTVLRVLSPIPIVPSKGTVELDGPAAALRVPNDRPEFYFRFSAEESFSLVKLTPKKISRVVETVQQIKGLPAVQEDRQEVATFKKQVGDMLFKIWPEKPLEPGEYALIEYTEEKLNLQVWDFGVGPAN
jgi:hypothetical protein